MVGDRFWMEFGWISIVGFLDGFWMSLDGLRWILMGILMDFWTEFGCFWMDRSGFLKVV